MPVIDIDVPAGADLAAVLQAEIALAPTFPGATRTLRLKASTTPYLVSSMVVVPANRAVSIVCEVPFGATLVNNGQDFIFGIDATPTLSGHRIVFRNLVLDGGGLLLLVAPDPEAQPRIRIEDCEVQGAKVAVTGNASRVEIASCRFQGNVAGVKTAAGADRWAITGCRFAEQEGVDLHLGGRDHRVTRCRFESKAIGSEAPSIVVAGGAEGHRIASCRFEGPAPYPLHVIRLGEAVGDDAITDVQIVDCHVRFGSPEIKAAYPEAAFAAASPLRGCQLRRCSTTTLDTLVADELHASLDAPPDRHQYTALAALLASHRDNRVVSHYHEGTLQSVFLAGGRGFDLASKDLRVRFTTRGSDRWRQTRNLLLDSDAVSGWAVSGSTLTALPETTLPGSQLGALTGILRLGKLARPALSAHIQKVAQPDGLEPDGACVFSVWLHSTSQTAVALWIDAGGLVVGGSPEAWLPTGNDWYRFHVVCWSVPSWVVGPPGWSLGVNVATFDGPVHLWHPQLEPGDTPTAYVPNGAFLREPRLPASAVVGDMVIGYSSGAPAAGSYGVGDRMVAVLPDGPDAPRGWIWDGKAWLPEMVGPPDEGP